MELTVLRREAYGSHDFLEELLMEQIYFWKRSLWIPRIFEKEVDGTQDFGRAANGLHHDLEE